MLLQGMPFRIFMFRKAGSGQAGITLIHSLRIPCQLLLDPIHGPGPIYGVCLTVGLFDIASIAATSSRTAQLLSAVARANQG